MSFLTSKDFQLLLKKDFAEAVKAKKYKRIEYPIWRQLIISAEDISIIFDGEIQSVTVELKQAGTWRSFDFPIDDGSLGTFLLDYILKSEPLYDVKKEDTDITTSSLSDALTSVSNVTSAFDNLSNTLSWTTTGTSTGVDWVNPYMSSTTTASIWDTNTLVDSATIEDFCKKSECPLNKKKEKKENPMNFGNTFNFGPCANDNVRMSLYGLGYHIIRSQSRLLTLIFSTLMVVSSFLRCPSLLTRLQWEIS